MMDNFIFERMQF